MLALFKKISVLAVISVLQISNLSAADVKEVSVVPGVSLELAQQRKAMISSIHYTLFFDVPDEYAQKITAQEMVSFSLSHVPESLQLDFNENSEKLHELWVNGIEQKIDHQSEHLVIDGRSLREGKNDVRINFEAGETSLNRSKDYLYTLFVPDRARTVFPVFDQPNLKATYDLALEVPVHWNAVSNGPLETSVIEGDRKTYVFETSDYISSYLFSFVAGEFETVSREHEGRTYRLLHRETDEKKVANNVDIVFEQHFAALKWLEEYTGIDYPFKKLDFALIPAFQYGGMEHVGAIQYRAGRLFLDENATQTQELNRANLIAHEVAHMWFGNLVTMDWFNDVWTKEVFANFMAAKIVNPSFPEVNHDLSFLVRIFPRAYAVDRTEGANAIRQHLPNLNEAGTLYGNIIYNKAPIMMQQLETLLGQEQFQEGMREYLEKYQNSNATWPGLIEILDKQSTHDLVDWSEVWVNTPRMPEFKLSANEGKVSIKQYDPLQENRAWPQQFSISSLKNDTTTGLVFNGSNIDASTTIPEDEIFFNADGKGYGVFPIDLANVEQSWNKLNELQRASALLSGYEQMLAGNKDVNPLAYCGFLMDVTFQEENQLIQNLALGQLQSVYWQYLSENKRLKQSKKLERQILKAMKKEKRTGAKRRLFRAFQSVALSNKGLNYLYSIWAGQEAIEGLNFSEADLVRLSAILAIKLPEYSDAIIKHQYSQIKNPDRKNRYEFIAPALSADEKVRDTYFDALKKVDNRAVEAWVLTAVGYLHHPLRREHAERYILPSMELLGEIQKTGDIFFPARWIATTMANHRSDEAVKIVKGFLQDRPNYNYQLKLKILQAADTMKRANALTHGR